MPDIPDLRHFGPHLVSMPLPSFFQRKDKATRATAVAEDAGVATQQVQRMQGLTRIGIERLGQEAPDHPASRYMRRY